VVRLRLRRILPLVVLLLASCLLACTKKPKSDASTTTTTIDAGAFGQLADAAPLEALPVGHWESYDVPGSKLCLTLMGHGFYRITATVPHYRNDARVSGRILDARPGKTPRSFDITISVRSIIAKEIGRCRKNWVNYRLPAAEVLGVRVTPTDGSAEIFDREDPWTGHFDDGGSVTAKEAPKRFSIQFDEAFEKVEMCAHLSEPRDAESPRCRTLKKMTSPTSRTFNGSAYGCKQDADCGRAYEGEMCSPCQCMNVAYYRGERDSPHSKQVNDWLASARETIVECRLPAVMPPPECPKCVDSVGRCINHTCKLVEREIDGG
jgi:hypothetical protein